MWFYEIDWPLTLEYVKVYLSLPPVAAAAVVFVVLLFRREIGGFINRMTSASVPGVQVSADVQPPPTVAIESAVEEELEAHSPDDAAPTQAIETIEDPEHDAEGDSEDRLFAQLNSYLIMNTQNVLDFVFARGHVTHQEVANRVGVNPLALPSIILALEKIGLISFDGVFLWATDLGRRYATSSIRAAHVIVQRWALPSPSTVVFHPLGEPPAGGLGLLDPANRPKPADQF